MLFAKVPEKEKSDPLESCTIILWKHRKGAMPRFENEIIDSKRPRVQNPILPNLSIGVCDDEDIETWAA